MELQKIEAAGVQDGYHVIRLHTSRGLVTARYYEAPGAREAVVWIGGVGGGFDSPARDLYPRLAHELQMEGVASLRVRYRHPTVLEEAVLDVLAGLAFLQAVRIESVAIVGHSFGGAVAIWSGTLSPLVKAVATLATQSYGTAMADQLSPRPLLLIHGADDGVLPPEASKHVYQRARAPRDLKLYEGAGHGLDEVADELKRYLSRWLIGALRPAAAAESQPKRLAKATRRPSADLPRASSG